MSIELLIGILVVVAIALIYAVNKDKGVDVNNDGKVDLEDAKAAIENTVEAVKEEVTETVEEVKEVVAEKKAKVKKAVTKAKKTTKAVIDFTAMTKKDLLAHAKANGVKANASMNKAAILEAIKNG